jgi:hypothetical protein
MEAARPFFATPARSEAEFAAEVRAALGIQEGQRVRIWDLPASTHCSIIGTCLSTGELRGFLKKAGLRHQDDMSDHELHGQAVLVAARREEPAKLLQKTLDRLHRLAINQLRPARTEGEVARLWEEALGRGEVPGAYWAVLTHPATTPALIRRVFGEVHMLSHLVGAANRADIRRLRQLEAEKLALEAKLARQQLQLRDGIMTRDATIGGLNAALAKALAERPAPADDDASDRSAIEALVARLQRQLAGEADRRSRLEARLAEAAEKLAGERKARSRAEARERALTQELDALEATIGSAAPTSGDASPGPDLRGLAVLYVGGRPHQIAGLRALTEAMSADFFHHDGAEDHDGRLAGLVSRADMAFFPVDCVSHGAAIAVKRLCGQAGKPFVPLRSAGLSSFLAALRRAAPDAALG